MRLWVTALYIVVAAICGSARPAYAVELTARLEGRVMAGLDDATRELVEHFPENVRKNLVQTMAESLKLLDDSVEKYAKRTEDLVQTTTEQFACVMVAIPGAAWKEFWATATGTSSTTVADVMEKYDSIGKEFGRKTPPFSYAIRYADFLASAKYTECAAGASPETKETIRQLRDAARPGWLVWIWNTEEAKNLCTSALDCVAFRRQWLMDQFSLHDARDITQANATARLQAIPVRTAGIFSFDYTKYEGDLRAIQSIDGDLRKLALKRALAVDAMLDKVKSFLDGVDGLLAVRPDDQYVYRNRWLFGEFPKFESKIVEFQKLLDDAATEAGPPREPAKARLEALNHPLLAQIAAYHERVGKLSQLFKDKRKEVNHMCQVIADERHQDHVGDCRTSN